MKFMAVIILVSAVSLGAFVTKVYEYIDEYNQRQQGALAALIITAALVGAWMVIRELVHRATTADKQHIQDHN